MAWYYYSGTSILALPVGKGEVLAVRPHTTVFVDASVESTTAFKRFGSVLRRTGAPKGAKPAVPAQPIAAVAVAVPHLMSDSFVEGSAAVAANLQTKVAIVAKSNAALADEVGDVVVADVADGTEQAVVDAEGVEPDAPAEDGTAEDASPRRRKSTKTTI